MPTISPRWLLINALVFVSFPFVMCTFVLPATRAFGQEMTEKQIEERLSDCESDVRQELEAMRCVLSRAQFSELLLLGDSWDHRDWIDAYWDTRNPIFTTEINEVRTEHERRVEYARMYFMAGGWPGWDDRGDAYIRYGHPTTMGTAEEVLTAAGIRPPEEFWYYADHDMIVRFVAFYGRSDFSYFQERVYAPLPLRFKRRILRHIDEAYLYPAAVPDLLPPEIAIMAPYEQYMKKVRRYEVIVDATPSTYNYDFHSRQVPFVFGIDYFRGGEGKTRVDVNIEFVPESGPIRYGQEAREYVATVVCRDFHGNPFERGQSTIHVPATKGVDSNDPTLIPIQLSFAIGPGFYDVGVTLQEYVEDRVTSYRTDITCPSIGSSLTISDIVTASVIEPADKNSPFNRGALRVVPHPYRTYRQPAVIPIYFEVYNLTPDDQGMSTYDIEYEVVANEARPRGFLRSLFRRGVKLATSSRFESSVHGSNDIVRLDLSSETLWATAFTLRVEIKDRNTGAKATQEVPFRILK